MAETTKLSVEKALQKIRKADALKPGVARAGEEIARLDEDIRRIKAQTRRLERHQRRSKKPE